MPRIQTLKFQGEIVWDKEKHRNRLALKNPTYFAICLSRYVKRGERKVWLALETQKKVRSFKANRRYWGAVIGTAVDELEESTGHTADELHEIFKQRHLKPHLIDWGGKKYPMWTTTDLSDGEFVEYCMKVERDLAEFGIRVPTPEEFYQGI